PENETYELFREHDFEDWRLVVDGLVARPSAFSLAELKAFPSRTQITHQACEEGWSFIAEWTGVPLSYVLNLAGVRPQARYVVFLPLDPFWDSLDMPEDRKSTRLNSSHVSISYAVFCLKKKTT